VSGPGGVHSARGPMATASRRLGDPPGPGGRAVPAGPRPTHRHLAGYVEDAIRERLERDRAELNQGEDFPPVTDHLRAPSAGRRVADLSAVVSVLRACYESRCGD
jgi:hypothetical protein